MKISITVVLVTLALLGCSGSAQLVRQNRHGGRIVLEGAYMPAVLEARERMVEHCRSRYQMRELGQTLEFRCRRARPALQLGVFATRDVLAKSRP